MTGSMSQSQPQLSCWQCGYIELTEDGPYSDTTPGVGGIIACMRGHWRIYNECSSEGEFRAAMASAAGCPDFIDYLKAKS